MDIVQFNLNRIWKFYICDWLHLFFLSSLSPSFLPSLPSLSPLSLYIYNIIEVKRNLSCRFRSTHPTQYTAVVFVLSFDFNWLLIFLIMTNMLNTALYNMLTLRCLLFSVFSTSSSQRSVFGSVQDSTIQEGPKCMNSFQISSTCIKYQCNSCL